MNTPHSAFHWPDHVIGKRESRRIREAHNALYNSHAELLTMCKRIFDSGDCVLGHGVASQLSEVIRKAEGRT